MPPIGLYLDGGLTHPLQQRTVDGKNVWVMDFGRLDAGEDKTFRVYVENQGIYAIEELKITVEPINRDGVDVFLGDEYVKRLESSGVHPFTVGWKVKEDAKLGRCQANITIAGYETE